MKTECTKTEAIFPIRNNVNLIKSFQTPENINKKYTFFSPMVAYLAVALNKQWIITRCSAWTRGMMLTQWETSADWVMNVWDALYRWSILGNEWPIHAENADGFGTSGCTETGTKFRSKVVGNWIVWKLAYENRSLTVVISSKIISRWTHPFLSGGYSISSPFGKILGLYRSYIGIVGGFVCCLGPFFFVLLRFFFPPSVSATSSVASSPVKQDSSGVMKCWGILFVERYQY